jgi:hypothetical protein
MIDQEYFDDNIYVYMVITNIKATTKYNNKTNILKYRYEKNCWIEAFNLDGFLSISAMHDEPFLFLFFS